MKKLIIRKIIDKKNFKYYAVHGEYFPAIDTQAHARLEHYRIFIGCVFVMNYVYLQEACLSSFCKTIFRLPHLPRPGSLGRDGSGIIQSRPIYDKIDNGNDHLGTDNYLLALQRHFEIKK